VTRRSKIVALALTTLVVADCIEGPTGPGNQTPARVRVEVVLPGGTPAAWLPAGDTLRILVRRAGRVEPVVDTAGVADSLAATVLVGLDQAVERFVATAELVYEGQVMFLAFDAIQLSAGLDTAITLTAVYVGPGGAATSLAVAAADSTLESGDTTRIVPTALDSLGQILGRVPVRFLTPRPDLFTVDTAGLVTALDGVPDSALVDVVMPTGLTASLPLWLIGSLIPLDGQTVVFISTRDGNREVYAMQADGTAPVRLTESPEDEFFPTWSPDGSAIAFEREVDGARQVFVMTLADRAVAQLTTEGANSGPRFSPDGARVAFTSTRGGGPEVWVMDADGANQRRVPDPFGDGSALRFGDWSPDGREIVFLRWPNDAGGWTEAWVSDSAGGNARMVLGPFASSPGGQTVGAPREGSIPDLSVVRWGPQGGLVAYTYAGTDTVVLVLALDLSSGGNVGPAGATFVGHAVFAGADDRFVFESDADGTHAVYYQDNAGTISRLSPAGIAEYEPDVVRPSPAIYVDRIVISPDSVGLTSDESGQTFTASGVDAGGQPVPVTVQWLIPSEGISALLPGPPAETVALGVGKTWAIASYRGWRTDSAPITITAATGPTAQRLVFRIGAQIYTMRGDGTDTVRLTTPAIGGYDPAFSPDGARIAWTNLAGVDADIWVMNADGSAPAAVTSGAAYDAQPSWSPDGGQVVFSANRVAGAASQRQLWLVRLDGTGLRQLTFPPAANLQDVDPAWSPDGSLILFTRYVLGTGTSSLRSVAVADGAERALAMPAGSYRYPAWVPDGTAFVYTRVNVGNFLEYLGVGRMAYPPGAETVLSSGSSPRGYAAGGHLVPSVAGDGLIAFSSGLGVTVMRGDGTALSGLIPGGVPGNWQPATPPRYVAAVAISGDVASAIAVGGTRQLAANATDQNGQPIVPAAGFRWTALDPAVATVDSTGLVTGADAGSARITLSSGLAAPDTVTVTVAGPVVPLTRTWVGGDAAGPTDWFVAGNWSPAGVPVSEDSVIIGSAATQPVLTAPATVARLRVTGGTLTLGGFRLTVTGDFSTEGATGRLVMQNGGDSLVVGGDATFAGAPLTGLLTAGVLRVAGSFTQSYVGSNWEAFQASGTHRTVLDGAAAQTVSFDSPGTAGQASFFHHLEIANAAGVTFASGAAVNGVLRMTSPVSVGGPGTITVVDSLVTSAGSAFGPAGARLGGGMAVAGTFTPALTEFFGTSQEIQGSLDYQSVLVTGQTSLAGPATFGGDLTIARIANQPTGDLNLNGQMLTVSGTLRTGQGSDAAGLLTMQNPADQLTVQGNATFAGAPLPGRLTAGTLRVRGDFTQVYVGSNWESFQASGSHLTILDGAAAQTVSFTNPGGAGQTSFFHHLEITNGGGVTFATGAVANGVVRVTTPVALAGPGPVTAGDSLVTVAGSSVTLGTLRLGGGMAVAGTFAPALTEFFGVAQRIQPGLAYQNVLVTGQTLLAGPATFTGDLTIARIVNQPNGDLNLAGQTLTVTGNLRTGQGSDAAGLLTMQDPADRLTVQGGATFAGGVTTGRLTAGELRLAGDFRQQYVGSNWAAFAPSGSHRVILDGAADQTVQFDSPTGAPGQASFFHGLSLSKPSGTITLLSMAPVNGVFEAAGQTVMGNGNALSAAGVNAVDDLILDHVPFTIGAGPVTGFDNVTFQNYAPTATQLTVARPGGAFTFTGLRFLSVPSTGFYVSATDLAPADGDVLTIDLVGSTPGDGSARTLTAGGAVVNWPGEAGGDVTWVGGDASGPTDWNVAGNWSPARVPGPADTAIIESAANQPVLTLSATVARLRIAGGNLTLGGRTLTVTGDFSTENGAGTVTMQQPADSLVVGGNALFQGGPTFGLLTDGVLLVAGDFGQLNAGGNWDTFRADDANHRTVLNGSSLQRLGHEGNLAFAHLDIANTGGGVAFVLGTLMDVQGDFRITTPAVLDALNQGVDVEGAVTTVPGSELLAAMLRVGDVLAVAGTYDVDFTEFSGTGQIIPALPYRDVQVSDSALLGASVTMTSLLISGGSSGSSLDVNGHTLVTTDLTTGGGGADPAVLIMQDPADTVIVTGDAEFGGGSTEGLLTEGVLELGGNFFHEQPGAFRATGNHRTILNGSALQQFWLNEGDGDDTEDAQFHHLEIANTGGVDIPLPPASEVPGFAVGGRLVIATPVPLTGEGAVIRVADSLVTVAGSEITLYGLSLRGGLSVSGALTARQVEFAGPDQIIPAQAAFSDVTVTGTARLAGPMSFPGYVSVRENQSNLVLDGHRLDVGILSIGGVGTGGAVTMTNAADSLVVTGDAVFAGSNSAGLLTAGALIVGGGFYQYENPSAFQPSGTYRTILNGATQQIVSFANPGTAGATSRFQDLELGQTGGEVRFQTAAAVAGELRADPALPQRVTGPGALLSVAGLDVAGLTLDGIAIAVGAGAIARFDDVTFQNQDPTAVQLAVAHPGSAASFMFDGVRFLTSPTTGYYVSATDLAPGDGNVLTIELAASQPADGSSRTVTSGGAVVTWLGTRPPPFAAMSAGQGYSCGLAVAGTPYCWGRNFDGSLGDGTTMERHVPTAVSGNLTLGGIVAGWSHACGLTSVGAAYCWGANGSGQLGDGTTTNSLVPVAVAGGLGFTALAAGEQHTCGVTASGSAYCWGANGSGQLGDGTTVDRPIPGIVSGGLSFGSVSAGGLHTCAVTAAGEAYCWGANTFGQLGDGSGTQQEAPVLVSGGLSFSTVSATGTSHSCGVTTDGAGYCWGWNGSGELGNGTTVASIVPVPVSGGLVFASVSAGGAGYTCGLTTSGAAHCWGLNDAGQLGDGTTTPRTSPVAVSGGLTFISLDAGFAHVAAIASGGNGYSWGANTSGGLGDGTTTDRSVPALVTGPLP